MPKMGEVCNKYYLYHEGHPLEGLCLGFLCFGRLAYSEPLQEEDWHYSPAPLRYCNPFTRYE